MHTVNFTCAAKYLPEKIVTNDTLSTFLDTSDEWIFSRTGIKQRHISLNENASDLGTKVCAQLLEQSGITAEEIGLIIVATITADFLTPSTACIIQRNIGAVNAFAFDIGAACSGFVYALSVAEKYVAAGAVKHAIVVGTEILSKWLDWRDRSTCVLFGDGAGGVLLTRGEKDGGKGFVLGENLLSDGRESECIVVHPMPVVHAFNGLEKKETTLLSMNGRAVFDFVTRNVPPNITEMLDKAGVSLDEIRYIIPHQANARIVEIIAKKLKISMDKFYINIDQYANTTAATIPIALAEMIEKGLLKPGNGDKVILVGFGAGATWGSILIQI
ncbi:MAG: ketoacyl-ACP synthase III [Clostridiales bacterium]|jgi:3-oxoacyl-[acyl-carrier-protein] synthase-3|nr:ketoacyl-ACP synthase III [Clostridiales bacterium]